MLNLDVSYSSGDPNTLLVSWNVSGDEFNCPYKVTVYRSDSFSGPYVRLVGPLFPEHVFIEDMLGKKGRPYFYALELDLGDQTRRVPSVGGVTVSADTTALVREFMRKTIRSIRLSRGRKVLYFPARTSGPFCHCFDRVTSKFNKNCRSCFGRRYQAGFYNPLVLHAAIGAGSTAQPNDSSSVKDAPTSAVIPAIALAREGDVIVEKENRRWAVVGVDVGEYGRVPIRQTLQLTPIRMDSVLQELPVDFSLLGNDEVAR